MFYAFRVKIYYFDMAHETIPQWGKYDLVFITVLYWPSSQLHHLVTIEPTGSSCFSGFNFVFPFMYIGQWGRGGIVNIWCVLCSFSLSKALKLNFLGNRWKPMNEFRILRDAWNQLLFSVKNESISWKLKIWSDISIHIKFHCLNWIVEFESTCFGWYDGIWKVLFSQFVDLSLWSIKNQNLLPKIQKSPLPSRKRCTMFHMYKCTVAT